MFLNKPLIYNENLSNIELIFQESSNIQQLLNTYEINSIKNESLYVIKGESQYLNKLSENNEILCSSYLDLITSNLKNLNNEISSISKLKTTLGFSNDPNELFLKSDNSLEYLEFKYSIPTNLSINVNSIFFEGINWSSLNLFDIQYALDDIESYNDKNTSTSYIYRYLMKQIFPIDSVFDRISLINTLFKSLRDYESSPHIISLNDDLKEDITSSFKSMDDLLNNMTLMYDQFYAFTQKSLDYMQKLPEFLDMLLETASKETKLRKFDYSNNDFVEVQYKTKEFYRIIMNMYLRSKYQEIFNITRIYTESFMVILNAINSKYSFMTRVFNDVLSNERSK